MATRKTISLDPNFKEFIALLNSEGVRYLLLGGYAVNYYGYHRFTGEIDFWIAVDSENANRVSKALQQFGFSADAVRPALFMEPNRVHMFGRVPVRVDLLTGPSGVEKVAPTGHTFKHGAFWHCWQGVGTKCVPPPGSASSYTWIHSIGSGARWP